MDLGCLDVGCMEKQRDETVLDSDGTDNNESVMAASKPGKNKALKETAHNLSALNKFTSQIKKSSQRRTSPLNWFPRKKADSFLKRKIKLLQEVAGMNSTLDETLGDSNPHYSRVLKEKIAVKEAAEKVMEARKAAMVEASWCRILRAARIESKESEALLLEAEKLASEAFEAAKAIGVIMYDTPNCHQKHYEIETSSVNESLTHTITASFETVFEVDKQVAAAVKAAFIRLANCTSINKDEFKELLRKISQNPDADNLVISECEAGSDHEVECQKEGGIGSQDSNCEAEVVEVVIQRKQKKRRVSDKLNTTKLVDIMLERLKCLQEEELSSLATIVATCGLSAALVEAETSKLYDASFFADCTSEPAVKFCRRLSSFGSATAGRVNTNGQMRRKQAEAELPSLDKFLVKRLTRLEREVQEAKNARKNETMEKTQEKLDKSDDQNMHSGETNVHPSGFGKDIEEGKKHLQQNSQSVPDVEIMLSDYLPNLEKGTERNDREPYELSNKKSGGECTKTNVQGLPSLDKFLVKHVSKLEREVEEAKKRRKFEITEGGGKSSSITALNRPEDSLLCSDGDHRVEKENFDNNKNGVDELDTKQAESSTLEKILVKPVCKRYQKKPVGNNVTDCEGLDKILVKHVSKLEKEKMGLVGTKEEVLLKVKRRDMNAAQLENGEGSLDQILVKHKSRLEKEKIAAAAQLPDDHINHFAARRQAREKELQEAWGGLSLGNSMRPHLSRLQRDKAAWRKAEEEELKAAKLEEV